MNNFHQPQTNTMSQSSQAAEQETDNDSGFENLDVSQNQLELRGPIFHSLNPNVRNKGLSEREVNKADKKANLDSAKSPPKLWSPVKSIEKEQKKLNPIRITLPSNIDFSMPITTTYLKYMKSLGCKEEDALDFDSKHVSVVINQFLHEIINHYFHK